MKLRKLTATFGCLQGRTLEISDGLTVIEAANGSGKSTWCAFLRTMLYGLDTRQRDKKGTPADKNRYRPWSGAPMEGLLVCEQDGRTLEVRRTSASGIPMGDFSAVYLDTGLPVPGMTGENAGELLTGISREVFDRSVFLRQTGLAVTQSQDLEKRIASLVTAGEESISWSEADETLKAWQHRRRYHKTGLLPQLEAEAEELQQTVRKTSSLRQELAHCQSRATTLRQEKTHWESRLSLETHKFQTVSQKRYAEALAEVDAAELNLQTVKKRAEQQPDKEKFLEMQEDMADIKDDMHSRRRLMTALVTLVVLLTLAAAAVYVIPQYVIPAFPNFPLAIPKLPLLFPALIAAGLWALVLIFVIIKIVCDRRDRKEGQALYAEAAELKRLWEETTRLLKDAQIRRERALKYFEAASQQSAPYLPPEAEACRRALGEVEQEIAHLQGQLSALGDPVFLDARLDAVQEQTERIQADHDALGVAMEVLREADSRLHARFSPQLSDQTARYFSRLTEGRYTQISLSRNLEVSVREDGSLTDRPLGLLSQGTVDQLYLALRLAVADLVLPAKSACPLILDDALLAFDDQRLKQALDFLVELSQNRQIILFTCHAREAELLEGRASVLRTVEL